jgi:hypothetical protein
MSAILACAESGRSVVPAVEAPVIERAVPSGGVRLVVAKLRAVGGVAFAIHAAPAMLFGLAIAEGVSAHVRAFREYDRTKPRASSMSLAGARLPFMNSETCVFVMP